MSSLSSLYRDLRRYRNLLGDVNHLANILDNAIDALEPAVSRMPSCFEIDEEQADAKQIANCRSKLVNHRSYLMGTASSSIERKISQIEDEIEELENEEDVI